MSNMVDERIVEMRFDNAQFEKNVQTSMSTLEKLKKSLKLSDSSKELENIGKAANNVRFDGMINGINTVNTRFSYVQGMILHQLNNIADTCARVSKNIVAAFTVNPIKDGFKEYETQMNAVQTILANTQKEGTNVKIVNAALDELNHYADKTIYNFTEMTRNIGTFTAAGVKLDTSVSSIKGIANLAAISGSTSQQASTAMYQLSQAIASGTVKLMDWNSVVNAGMGGQVFQDALIKTSEHLKTGAKAAIDAKGSFRESLSTGWLTTEVLTETLDMFATAADTQSEYEAAVQKFVSKGYTQEEAKQMADMAKTAGEAATKVKTFTQLIDTLKEALGSGWTETWRIIIGDFEEARTLWTGISDVLSNFINKVSDARNRLVESAMGKSFSDLSAKLTTIVEPAKKAADTVQKVSTTITDLGSLVDDVIVGKFGNGQARFDALTNSGKNYYEVQNKVNEKLGDSFRYTQDQIDAQNKLLGSQNATAESTEDATAATIKLTDEQKNQIKAMVKLSDEELRAKGYTEEQIKAFNELRNTANKLGIPIDKFIDQLDQINGRWLMIEGFKNIGRAIIKVFSSMGEAAREVFDAIKPETIFNALGAFHKLTASLIMSDETADKLKRTFKGLFAAIDIVRTIAGGGFSIAFRVLAKALGTADVGILDVTSRLGDMIVKLRDFLFNNELVNKGVELLGTGLEKLGEIFGKVIDIIAHNPVTQKFISFWDDLFNPNIENNGYGIVNILKNLGDAMDISGEKSGNFKDIMEGINSAFNISNWKWAASLSSTLAVVNSVLTLFGTDLAHVGAILADYITKLAEWIKVHTPFIQMQSKISAALAAIIEGLTGCVKAFMQLPVVQKIIQSFKDLLTKWFGDMSKGFDSVNIESFCNKIKSAFSNLQKWISGLKDSKSLGKDIVAGIANGITEGISIAINAIKNVVTAIKDTFCSPSVGFDIHSPSKWGYEKGVNIVEGITNGIKSAISLVVNAIKAVVKAIKNAFNGSKVSINFDGVLNGLKNAVSKFKDILKDFNWKYLLTLIPVGLALMIAKRFISLVKTFEDGINNINSVIAGLAGIEKSFSKVLDSVAIDIKAKALQKVAVSLAILVGAVIALSAVDTEKLYGAVATIGILSGILVALMLAVSKLDGAAVKLNKETKGIDISGLKTTILQIGATLLMLATAVKIMGGMNPDEMKRGFIGLAGAVSAVGLVLAAFGVLSKMKATKDIDKVGGMILKVSVAMLLMVKVCQLASRLKPDEIRKGATFMAGFSVFVAAMAVCYRLAGKDVNKLGGMVIKITVALGLMVGVCKLIGQLSPSEMAKGAVFAAGFSVFVASLVLIAEAFPDAQIKKISGLVMSITISLGLMIGVCKLVAQLSPSDMIKGAEFAAGFLVFVAALVKVTTIASTGQTAKVSATILSVSVAVGALAVVSVLLGLVDTQAIIKGVTAVTALGAIMTAMIWATRGANECKANLTAMTVAIALMAGSVAALGLIDPKKLARATTALVSLMASFALMEKMSTSVKGAWKTILTLTVVVTALASVLTAMSKLKVKNSIQNGAAISTLLIAMATSVKILSTIKGVSKGAIASIGVLTAVVAGLGVIIGVMEHFNVNPSMETATALSVLLLAMSGVTVILSSAGGSVSSAVSGVAGLLVVVTAIGGFITALGYLNDKFPQLEKFLNKGIPLLQSIGTGIGAFVGGIASGFAGATLEILPTLGTALSNFMNTVSGFVDGAGRIDSKVLSGVGYLSGAIVLLSAAEFVNGITSLFSVNGNLAGLGTDLSNFIENASGFLDGITNVDPKAVDAASTLSKMILKLSEASFISGLSTLMTLGLGSFENIGKQLTSFGKAMVSFSETVSGKIDPGAVTDAANAGKLLAELENSLPKQGGLWQLIAGEEDIRVFGDKCRSFASAISEFSKTVSANGGVDSDAVQKAVDAGNLLSALESALPKQGGLWQLIAGEEDIGLFGDKCKVFGQAITQFSDAVSAGGGIDTDAVQKATNAGNLLSALENSLPKQGGAWQLIAGEEDIALFGDKISAFGAAITQFSSSVTVDESVIEKAVSAGKAMAALQKAIPDKKLFDGKVSLDTFGSKIRAFGNGLAGFAANVADVEFGSVQKAITQANRLKNLAQNMSDLDTSGIGQFKSVIKIGSTIQSFSEKVSGISVDVISQSITAANRLRNLISNLSGIDASGVESFKVGKIGDAIRNYSEKVSGIDPSVVISSVLSATRLANLIRSLSGIDTSGVELFNPSHIGTELSNYANKVAEVDVASVYASVSSAQTLVNFIRGLSGIDGGGASTFVQALNTLGTASVDGFVNAFASAGPKVSTAMSSMMTSMATTVSANTQRISSAFNGMLTSIIAAINSRRGAFTIAGSGLMTGMSAGVMIGSSVVVTNATVAITRIVTMILSQRGRFQTTGTQLMTGLGSGISSGTSTVVSAISSLMNRANNTVTSRRGQFQSAGRTLMSALAGSIRSSASTINSAISAAMSRCTAAIRAHRGSFSSAGSYLGDGLIIGINAKKSAAYNAGFALGQAAVKGEKDGQQSKSPSKLTKKAGRWLGEGLVIGMEQMSKNVYQSGKAMGTKAVDSISGALARVQSISEDSLDMAPTLRPVVDLDSLQNGDDSLRIGADLSASLLSGPVTTLKDIISDAQSSINASNNEVVKAIGDLRNDMSEYYSGADTEIALYADMKKLASSLAKPMNRQLLELQKRGSR